DVAQLGKAAEPRLALLHSVLVLLGGETRADRGGREVEARLVRELRPLTNGCARLRERSRTEGLLLLVAQPVQILLRLDLLPDERHLDALEARVEWAGRRSRVDVDHRRDSFGNAIARRVARCAGAAVYSQHGGCARRLHRFANRVDVVRERDL